MKISLFDKDDLSELERTLRDAIVRAFRIIAKEGLVQNWSPPPDPVKAPSQEMSAKEAELNKDHPSHTSQQKHPILPDKGEPIEKIHPALQEGPAKWPPAPEKKEKGKRRSIRNIARVQSDRPFGYITTDEASKLIDMSPDKAVSTINVWALERQIPSMIVTSIKPPTKGLPGRLTVDKAALIKRESVRRDNIKLPAGLRTSSKVK